MSHPPIPHDECCGIYYETSCPDCQAAWDRGQAAAQARAQAAAAEQRLTAAVDRLAEVAGVDRAELPDLLRRITRGGR